MTYEVQNRTSVRPSVRAHLTKYLLSYIGCHGYILYRNGTKLWDHVRNPLYISTTKFGNPNLMARYFLSAPKIAENRKISNFKGYFFENRLLLHKYFDAWFLKKMIFWYFIVPIEFYNMLFTPSKNIIPSSRYGLFKIGVCL